MKNLRDEFDPVHANARRGWHKRPLRPNRQRVLGEFCDASDEAVLEIVARLLAGDREVGELITKPLAEAKETVANVAERIRSGKLAEKYFMEHSEAICGVPAGSLLDCRDLACGYDFGVAGRQALAIEVKGMRPLRGAILFSDNEWRQANRRTADYWLVVVGGLETRPRARLIENPDRVARDQFINSQGHRISVDRDCDGRGERLGVTATGPSRRLLAGVRERQRACQCYQIPQFLLMSLRGARIAAVRRSNA